jgi:hypothetical protein
MRHAITALCSLGIIVGATLPIQSAQAYPALYLERTQLRIPLGHCVGAALDAVKRSGLQQAQKDSEGAGGTTPTARATIRCVRLPHAGPCNTDGATAVFIAASDMNFEDAKGLVQRMNKALGNPVLIDCN